MYLTVQEEINKKPKNITIEIPDTLTYNGHKVNLFSLFEDVYQDEANNYNCDNDFSFESVSVEKPEEGNPIEDYIRKQIPRIEKAIEIDPMNESLLGKLYFAEKCLEELKGGE